MKFLLIVVAGLVMGHAVLADHSLSSAMGDSPAVAKAVSEIETKLGWTCDTSTSYQMSPYGKKGNGPFDSWRQRALCYKTIEGAPLYGNELGLNIEYQIAGPAGFISVEYTWGYPATARDLVAAEAYSVTNLLQPSHIVDPKN